jgi:bile acid:Na+ symporter, BASS family
VQESFEIVAKVAVLVFVVTCMLTAGLGLGVGDIVGPLCRWRLVVAALGVNFVVSPAIAYAICEIVGLDPPYATGLLLLSAAAGAPFLPKLAQLAKGDIAFSVGLMLLLTVGTVVFLPIALPILIPGQSAEPWPILRPLLLTMLLPLSVGMLIRNRFQHWASRLRPDVGLLSNVSMVLAIVVLIGIHFQAMIGTFGSGAVAVAVLFISLLLVCGYMLGGPTPGTRSVLGLGTGQRNIAAALIVATQNSEDPAVVVMLIASTLAGLIVLAPAAIWFARRATATRPGGAESVVESASEVLQ